jgi:hypothetical protein
MAGSLRSCALDPFQPAASCCCPAVLERSEQTTRKKSFSAGEQARKQSSFDRIKRAQELPRNETSQVVSGLPIPFLCVERRFQLFHAALIRDVW